MQENILHNLRIHPVALSDFTRGGIPGTRNSNSANSGDINSGDTMRDISAIPGASTFVRDGEGICGKAALLHIPERAVSSCRTPIRGAQTGSGATGRISRGVSLEQCSSSLDGAGRCVGKGGAYAGAGAKRGDVSFDRLLSYLVRSASTARAHWQTVGRR
jgi:hypothetical protein